MVLIWSDMARPWLLGLYIRLLDAKVVRQYTGFTR